MKVIIIGALVLSHCAHASSISYPGTLSDANSVHLIMFTVGTVSNVTLQTYSYGGSTSAPGGTNAAGNAIVPGGFDPVIAAFGPDNGFIDQNDDGLCPIGAFDGGNCFDSTLELVALLPGIYTVSLTVAGNYAAGAHLSDGFTGGGDLFGRTNSFAVDLTINPIASVPEIGSLGAAGVGLLLMVLKTLTIKNRGK